MLVGAPTFRIFFQNADDDVEGGAMILILVWKKFQNADDIVDGGAVILEFFFETRTTMMTAAP